MGLRFRKSINLGGGFRINLSKSGVGYSWGVKGFRVTKTAKGKTRKTTSIPGTGISFISESNHKKKANASAAHNNSVHQDGSGQVATNIQNIEALDVSSFRPAEYKDLFNAVKKLNAIFALIVFATAIALLIHPLLCLVFVAIGIWFMLTQHVQLDYEFDEYAKTKWELQSKVWANLSACKKLWYITVIATTKAKTNAGADAGANLTPVSISKKLPWYLKSDLHPLILKLKKQKLVFMPDRILVIEGAKLGAIPYNDIEFKFGIQPYAGDISAPKETEIIEHRWLKVNKNGTPDKRFKGNRQVPVYKLGAIYMTSQSGLNVMLLASKVDPVEKLEEFLTKNR